MHPISVLTQSKNYQREDSLMSLIVLTHTKEINKGQILYYYAIYFPLLF